MLAASSYKKGRLFLIYLCGVKTAKLSNDDFSELGVGIFDIDGILKFIAISLLYIRLIRNPHSA